MFNAILIEKDAGGQRVGLAELSEDRLPEGDVTVRVACSTLNYKDALAITGKTPVVRKFPMVPGIDFAGVVEASEPATVAPFILRGVTLAGIDSVMCPRGERIEAWRRLAQLLDPSLLECMTQTVALHEAIPVAEKLIAGAVRGRVIVPIP
ncbi:MAG: hypothetical protein EPO23_14065 [Xanthobacteraceae bacterium]|nr:MAG: hypothetical protein EPO23_14065 [Xanthobacteraceae bacterium]